MLERDLVAIDISDQSVKVLVLDRGRHIAAYGSAHLRKGVVHKGLIADSDAFSEKLKDVLEHTKPTALLPSKRTLGCIAGLPDSQIYVHSFELPKELHHDAILERVKEEAAGVVPFELNDVYYSFHTVPSGDVQHVTSVCAPKKAVCNYVSALTKAGLRPAALGGAFFSLGRSLLPQPMHDENFLIIDIGANATNIGVFDFDAVANFTVRVEIGGELLTRTLSEELDLSKAEAEEAKCSTGLKDLKKKKGVSAVLASSLEPVMQEIRTVQNYYEDKTSQKVTKAVLAGGTSLMPGIREYLESQTGITAELGDPFKKLKEHGVFESETSPIFFAGVIGLALRAQDDSLPGIDLLTQYREDRGNAFREGTSFSDIRSAKDLRFAYGDVMYFVQKSLGVFVKKTGLDRSIDTKLLLSSLAVLVALAGLLAVITIYV